MSEWGWFPTRRSKGSRRRRLVLSIASVVTGLVLFGLWVRLGHPEVWEATFRVVVVLVLLIIGVLWDLRPWSDE